MKEWLLDLLGGAVVIVLGYYLLGPSDEEDWEIEFVVNDGDGTVSKKFMYKAKNKLTETTTTTTTTTCSSYCFNFATPKPTITTNRTSFS